MIYLIITTSINNKYNATNAKARQDRYMYAISETLKILPCDIKPIIVENNGQRDTYLDDFTHGGRPVNIIYTTNNQRHFKSKGVNELLDVMEVIDRFGINNNDIIIKLTGRYRVTTPAFFTDILENGALYDVFMKFYEVCTLKYNKYDCILGCYAIRAQYLKLFNYMTIDNYNSAEIAFARYVRFCGANIKEVDTLGVECQFADDLRILHV